MVPSIAIYHEEFYKTLVIYLHTVKCKNNSF